MSIKSLLLAAAAGTLLAGPLLANGVVLDAKVMKSEAVAAPGGATTERLVPVARAVPGDALVYSLAYRNTGNAPATDIVLNNPVPANVIYRGPGTGGEPDVSVDGNVFAPIARLSVAAADGTRRPARLADIRFVRWRLAQPIAPGASGEVSFHAALR